MKWGIFNWRDVKKVAFVQFVAYFVIILKMYLLNN